MTDQAYGSFEFLQKMTPDRMRTTPESENHIANIFMHRLKAYDMELNDLDFAWKPRLISALKQAIYDGWLIATHSVSDPYNPKDRQLEILVRLNISDISPDLEGDAEMRVLCRLSVARGTVTIRNIEKGFRIS